MGWDAEAGWMGWGLAPSQCWAGLGGACVWLDGKGCRVDLPSRQQVGALLTLR